MVNILTMKEMKNEVPKKETQLQAGQRLYEQSCMACHGTERKGGGNYPSIVEANKKYNARICKWFQPATDDACIQTIRTLQK